MDIDPQWIDVSRLLLDLAELKQALAQADARADAHIAKAHACAALLRRVEAGTATAAEIRAMREELEAL